MSGPCARLVHATVLTTCLAVTTSAAAQSARGFALHATDPAPAGDTFTMVPDGRVRGLFEVHAAFWRTYASDLDTGRGTVEHGAYGNADLTLALAEAMMLNVGLADAVLQNADAGVASASLGDVRSTLRLTWLGGEGPLAVGTQFDVWFPTGSEDALTSDGKVRFGPKVAVSGAAGPIAYAATGGYLLRPERGAGDATVGPGPTFGAGLALRLLDQAVQVGPELWGQSAGGGESTALEAALGLRVRVHDVLVGATVGTGLTDAPGTADLRAMLGVAFVRDERVPDPDGDGLTGNRDACPSDPGLTPDGCPDTDGDRDTIADAVDACPSERGLVHEDPRRNGCPPAGGALPPP